MKTLTYKIITPERLVMSGQAVSVTVMTESGEITILPGHIPLATLLRAGEMRVKDIDKHELSLALSTGLFEVKPDNEIIVLADTAERADELELEQIEVARKKAEEALQLARTKEDVSIADAVAHLERELVRYRVAIKYKHR